MSGRSNANSREPPSVAASGTEAGDSGPITTAVGLTIDGRIRSVALLEDRDTPDLMKRSQAGQ